MVRSMTGFGRGEAADNVRVVTVEIKAVNHRYGEFFVKLPRRYGFAEDVVKKTVRSAVKRGKVDISVSVTSSAEEEAAIFVDMAAAKQYFRGLRELQQSFDIYGNITLELLASMPDVMKTASSYLDEAAIVQVIVDATSCALREFDCMRVTEGEQLAADLLLRADIITGLVDSIEARAPELSAVYAEKLKERIDDLLGNLGANAPNVTEDRLALEVAVFADKSNITEEIVRLRSHVGQLRSILKKDGNEAAGKKLDFLAQEMNREANTIGSKANDLKITDCMLELKSEIEKIREQIQNIE